MLADLFFKGANLNKQQLQLQQASNSELNVFEVLTRQFDDIVFESSLKELQQQIGLQKVERKSQTFQDLKRYIKTCLQYPSTEFALLHRNSNRLGSYDVEKQHKIISNSQIGHSTNKVNEFEVCPCCGLLRQQEQLKVCVHSFKDVAAVGISIYMFYRTMRNLIALLFMALIIFGAFALATNLKSSTIWNDRGPEQLLSSYIKVGLGSKIYLAISDSDKYDDLLIWQVWLGLVMVIAFNFGYVYMEWIQVTKIREVQNLSKSAADYTILMKGVPSDIKQEEILLEMNNLLKDISLQKNPTQNLSERSQIAKINIGVPIDVEEQIKNQIKRNLLDLQKLINKSKSRIGGWLLELCDGTKFKTSPEERNDKQRQYLKNKHEYEKKIKELTNNVKALYKQQSSAISTDVLITFQSKKTKQLLLESISHTALDKLLHYLTLSFYRKTVSIRFNRQQYYSVVVEQASQPEDIIWKNIGKNTTDIFLRKCITFFFTFVLLGMSFMIIYGLSNVQYYNQQKRYISFIISLAISVFNFLILFSLRILTSFELNVTQTNYQSSLAVKAIVAQLINTIIIPIVINRFLKRHDFLYEKSGLAEDVFLMGITNSFITPIMKILDLSYLFNKYLIVWYNENPSRRFFLNQVQLNRLYELNEFQNGIEYVYIIGLYLFTCFFMSLQPIIIVFAILGLFLNYWAQKYCLFHRCKRPVPGTRILYDTMVQFVYAGGLFYSLGSLTFINFIPEDIFMNKINAALVANLIAVGVSALSLFIPFSFLYELVFSSQNNSQKYADEFYSESRILLPSQYDRMNPATSESAIKEYLQFLNQQKTQLKLKKQDQAQVLYQIFANQSRNNYNSKFQSSNPFNAIKLSLAGIDQLMNQKMQPIHPQLAYNFLFPDLLGNEIQENATWKAMKNTQHLESSSENLENQLSFKLQQPVKPIITHVSDLSFEKKYFYPQRQNLQQDQNQVNQTYIVDTQLPSLLPGQQFKLVEKFRGNPFQRPLGFGFSSQTPQSSELINNFIAENQGDLQPNQTTLRNDQH